MSEYQAMRVWKQMLQEVLDDEGGFLNDWELQFIDSLHEQGQRKTFQPSQRQLDALEGIWKKVFA